MTDLEIGDNGALWCIFVLFCFFTGSPFNEPPVGGGSALMTPAAKLLKQFAPCRYSEGNMSKEKKQIHIVEEDPN